MKRKESPKDPDAASKRPCTNSSPPPLALPSIQEPLISETVYATHIKEIQVSNTFLADILTNNSC